MLTHIPNGGKVAEVGVLDGDFSQRILDLKNPEELWLIDAWQCFDDMKHRQDISNATQAIQDSRFQRVNNRFKEEILNKQVYICRAMSTAAYVLFEDESLDWIYLDANHSYEDVSLELKLYYPKIKKGGFITGDDYVDRSYYGVIRAVNEFSDKMQLKVYVSTNGGNQFLIRK